MGFPVLAQHYDISERDYLDKIELASKLLLDLANVR
jgi:hypothetical protein